VQRQPLAEVVDAALRSLGSALARHKVAVEEVPRELPPVPVDAALVQRVVASLAGNAAKHTPAGTQLTIAAREVGDEIEVRVSDDGPGLPRGAR